MIQVPSQPKEYKRLPGKKRGFLGISKLWLGKDHLLRVSHRMVVEEYKRFYFGDIQAIIISRNHRGLIQRIILAILAAIFLLSAWSAGYGFRIFFMVMASLSVLLALIDILRGPTCSTWVQTAVQTEKLESLNRLRTARKVLDRIRPLIENVQGRASSQDIERHRNRQSQSLSADNPGARNRPTSKHEPGRYHQALFILLLVDGLFTLTAFLFRHPVTIVLGTLVNMAVMALIIIALVRQNDSDMDRAVTRLTWAVLVYNILMFINGYINSILLAVEQPVAATNQLDMLKMMAARTPAESSWLLFSYLFFGGASLAFGLFGLTLLSRHRRTHQSPNRPIHSAEPPLTP